MLLSDVLKVIGTSELRDFPWGQNVVALVNSFAPEQSQLTIASNGSDLELAVSAVEEPQRGLLLQAKVGMGNHVGKVASANDNDPQDEQEEKTRSVISIGFTAILCLIAVILTLSMGYGSSVNGTEIDVEGLGSILTIIKEIILAL